MLKLEPELQSRRKSLREKSYLVYFADPFLYIFLLQHLDVPTLMVPCHPKSRLISVEVASCRIVLVLQPRTEWLALNHLYEHVWVRRIWVKDKHAQA